MSRLPALPIIPRVGISAIDPQPGWWLIRLVRGAVPVPCCIRWVHTRHEPDEPANMMVRSRFLAAFILDEPADLDRVWLGHMGAITEAEYRYRCAGHRWRQEWAPEEAEALNPRKAADLTRIPPVF